ncbi:Phospholipase A1-IIgamma [Linum grandiflorum]
MASSIASNWKKLSGEDNWDGLLDSLSPEFRRYLIHYGERVEAVNTAFNYETKSKAYSFSLHPPESFFSNVNLQKGNPYKYKVTKFFYATSEFEFIDYHLGGASFSAWMGYVAVTTNAGKDILGRRDIMVCWRGAVADMDWFQGIVNFPLVSASEILGTNHHPKVHNGFLSVYSHSDPQSTYNKTSARDQVLAEIRRLVDLYKDEEVSITVAGHSMGASLATLNAVDIVVNNYHKPTGSSTGCMVTAFAYASPLVGDLGFMSLFNEQKDLRVLRIRNFLDVIVPNLPPVMFGFRHVGKELLIHSFSPYLKPLVNPHSLEVYMHGVAGATGFGKFKLVVKRDVSLLNKWLDALEDKYKVPKKWWVTENRTMIQDDSGVWMLEDVMPPPPVAHL